MRADLIKLRRQRGRLSVIERGGNRAGARHWDLLAALVLGVSLWLTACDLAPAAPATRIPVPTPVAAQGGPSATSPAAPVPRETAPPPAAASSAPATFAPSRTASSVPATPSVAPISYTLTATVTLLPPTSRVQQYVRLDATHLWIVVDGKLLFTGDGGRHWREQYAGRIDEVSFVDAEHGWLSGAGIIQASRDGGETWVPQYHIFPPKTAPMATLDFLSPHRGWVAGANDLLTTADGGKSWQPLITDGTIDSVQFFNARQGWGWTGCGACQPTLWHTQDGGRTWIQGTVPGCAWYKSGGLFHFTGPLTGWSVCIPGNPNWVDPQILRETTDGGLTWRDVYSTEPLKGVGEEKVADLFFMDDQQGWVTISRYSVLRWPGLLRVTRNGGRSWQTISTSTQVLKQIRFVSASHGYAALEDAGVLLETLDGGDSWRRIYGSVPTSHLLHFFDRDHGIGVGIPEDVGRLLFTDDGGRHWQARGSIAFACGDTALVTVQDLAFADGQRGSLGATCLTRTGATDHDVLLRTSDGGATWTAAPAPTATVSPTPLPPVHIPMGTPAWTLDEYENLLPDPRTGTLAGNPPTNYPEYVIQPNRHSWYLPNPYPQHPCALLKTLDGGQTWTRYNLWTCPQDLAFVDAVHGWMQDMRDHLYTTADGGTSWVQVQ